MRSDGGRVARFIEEHLVHSVGDQYGQPFRLRQWQRDLLDGLYQLDGDDRRRFRRALIGLPKGSGKSELAAALGLYHLFAEEAAVIPVAAANFDQADVTFGAARVMVENSPTLAELVECYETEIKLRDGPGRMFRVAAIGATNDGLRPTVAIFDEVHELVGSKERMHLVIGNGLQKRRDGLEINITTAGVANTDSLCERLYRIGLADADPRLFFWWREAAAHWDLSDPDQRRRALLEAHPAAGDWIDTDAVVARYDEIPEHEWRRYYANQWVDVTGDSWLADRPGAWEACRGDATIPPGSEVFVGVDMALRRDSTAVVAAWRRPDGRFAVQARVWEPDGGTIDHLEVMAHLRGLAGRYTVREISYDPRFFEVPAQILMDEGLPLVEVPQTPERMAPACGRAWELIVARRVVHSGDPVLARHVNSAVRREGDRGWTLSKGKSRRHIDACIALVLALARGERPDDKEPELQIFVG